MGVYLMRHASHRRASHGRASHRLYLIGLHLINLHLIGVHLMGVHLLCMHLVGMHLMGVHLIYESSLRAGPGWRESLYRHQGCLEASDCGRLGRQAAGHPWSALRVVKSYRKTAQRPRYCSKPKQQLYIRNGTRAHYLNYLPRGRVRGGKEAQAIGLASQSDGQKSDGQTGRNKADERWYPSRPCSVLNSGL
jgi:hypothetical protein